MALFKDMLLLKLCLAIQLVWAMPYKDQHFDENLISEEMSRDIVTNLDPSPAAKKINHKIISGYISRNQFSRDYSYVDPKNLIRDEALENALEFYDTFLNDLPNTDYLIVLDFKMKSSLKRFFLIDMKTGEVTPYLAAHGQGSDPDHDGFAKYFSNENDSKMSSLGFYLTAETYNGKHGYSLRLDGLSDSNSRARERAVVIHPAKYVVEGYDPIGRSWGCPALAPEVSEGVINKIKNGTLIFATN